MMEKEYEKAINDVNMAMRYENDLKFKVDLINVLKEIRDELKKDSYVNVKNPVLVSGVDFMSELTEALKNMSHNAGMQPVK